MTGKEFRVWLGESAPGEAADSLRAPCPGPDSTLALSMVSTLPRLVPTRELAAPETIFPSLGKPDPLEAVRRVHRAAPENNQNHSSLQEELGSPGCEQAVRQTVEFIAGCLARKPAAGVA
jgi:hypothetical protein